MDVALASGITMMLRAWRDGDSKAVQRIFPPVYDKLHRIARRYMSREDPAHILQSTALVNETYLQLARLRGVNFRDREHFFAFCALLMRHVLTDHARARLSLKAGGAAEHVPLDEHVAGVPTIETDRLALDDALNRLATIDERQCKVVQLRFLVGLSVKETAAVLGISERTVKEDWRLAKLWLLRELDKTKHNG
jgi:RNA polymerase sigma factor (TIGR02999 family)